MGYKTQIEGFEGRNLEVNVGFWSGPKLMVNGEIAPKGTKRGEIVMQRNDGRQVTAAWKSQGLGLDVPQLVVEGKVIHLVEPLKWYQWVWGAWPIGLLFIGGGLGALAGMLAVAINTRVYRAEMNNGLKYALVGGVSLLAVAAYLIAAIAITLLVNR